MADDFLADLEEAYESGELPRPTGVPFQATCPFCAKEGKEVSVKVTAVTDQGAVFFCRAKHGERTVKFSEHDVETRRRLVRT